MKMITTKETILFIPKTHFEFLYHLYLYKIKVILNNGASSTNSFRIVETQESPENNYVIIALVLIILVLVSIIAILKSKKTKRL